MTIRANQPFLLGRPSSVTALTKRVLRGPFSGRTARCVRAATHAHSWQCKCGTDCSAVRCNRRWKSVLSGMEVTGAAIEVDSGRVLLVGGCRGVLIGTLKRHSRHLRGDWHSDVRIYGAIGSICSARDDGGEQALHLLEEMAHVRLVEGRGDRAGLLLRAGAVSCKE